jgi:hypothetical protein
MSRHPHLLDNRLRDGSKVSLICWLPFTSQEDSWYPFLLEAESTPEPWCSWKDWVNWKNPVTSEIEPATLSSWHSASASNAGGPWWQLNEKKSHWDGCPLYEGKHFDSKCHCNFMNGCRCVGWSGWDFDSPISLSLGLQLATLKTDTCYWTIEMKDCSQRGSRVQGKKN